LEEFRSALAADPADLIFIDEAHLAPYAWPLPQVPCILARQKADFLYYRDIFWHTPFGSKKMKALTEWLLFRLYENRLYRRFNYGVVVSEAERKLYLGLNPHLDLAVIPNGVDTSFFQMRPLSAGQEPTILFHGVMSYEANIDAAVWFAEKIFPLVLGRLPHARLVLAGRDPADDVQRLACPGRIVVTGTVSDMRDYLYQSNVVVVPIRIGHGTRLKIPEAMAAGRPVVSTPVGTEGLMAESGKHLLVAESPVEFAANVVEVLTDRSLAEYLATNGRQLVEDNYSWRSIGEKLSQYCQFVVGRSAYQRK
jgi:glycosyltransferase involved in cell wall biosynthesis